MSTPNSNDRTMLDFFSAVPKPKQKLSENKNKKKRKTIIESSDSSYDSTSDTCNNDDERFNQLGLLAWYDDELLDIIKLEPIGNNYIQEKPDHRKKMFGQSFSSSDFEHKYFN